jgi:MFS transporter, DHA1 family, multidrug resistance protein
VAGAIAPALSHSVLWLAYGQLSFTLTALALWLTSRHYRSMLLRQPDGEI